MEVVIIYKQQQQHQLHMNNIQTKTSMYIQYYIINLIYNINHIHIHILYIQYK